MTVSTGEQQRVAYCQCGTRLAGDSEGELFQAAERHIAERHPSLIVSGATVGSGPSGADAHATEE